MCLFYLHEGYYTQCTWKNIWEIVTWIFIAFTLILNLVLIAILIFRRNLNSIVNKSEQVWRMI